MTLNLDYRIGPSDTASLGFSQSCTENFEIAPHPVFVHRKPSIYPSLNAIMAQLTNCPFGVNATIELKNTTTCDNTGTLVS